MLNEIKNKKIFSIILIFILSLIIKSNNFAKNNVSNMYIDVLIHDDGSSTITEMWEGMFDEGTENYIPIRNNDFSVSNFKVQLNKKEYEFIYDWDVDASFEEKKYKCGINHTKEGIELCFGLSEFGKNTYYFSYDVSSLVKSYDDKDGFNYMFVNPGMSIFPTNVSIRLRLDNDKKITSDIARIWGFRFNGEAGFGEGNAIVYTDTPLTYDNGIIIMMSFEKGVLNPNEIVEGTFDDKLKNRAFENSTYQNEESNRTFDIIFFLIKCIIGITIITFVISLINYIREKFSLKVFYKNNNYFRDIPNMENISLTYALYNDFNLWKSKETNIIGALIMKMIKEKDIEPMQEKSVGFLGIEKMNTSLKLIKEPKGELEKKLYNIIINAAGEDNILQENELKKYSKVHYNELIDFLDLCLKKGHNDLNAINGYKKILGKKLKDLTDAGKKELSEVYGLRKFIDEFTLLSEREIPEVYIWEDLLIYATLFGLAKKVLLDMKKVYPEEIVKIDNYTSTVYIGDLYYRAMYINAFNARSDNLIKNMSKKGFGGHVSLGGGGGFSGGGFGGGSR